MASRRIKINHKFNNYFLFIGSILILVILLNYINLTFKIRNIKLLGPKLEIYGLTKLANENLLLLDIQKTTKNILADNFIIKDIQIKKILPDTLELAIEPREGNVILIGSPSAYLISDDGVILKKMDQWQITSLPMITDHFNSFRIGKSVDSDIKSLVFLYLQFKKLNIEIGSFKVDRTTQQATIELPDTTKILISLTKSNTTLPASLQIIMSRFRIEGRTLASIDFRFDKPIITLKNGEKIPP